MYQAIRSVVEADFLAVNKFIVEQLESNIGLIENIAHYITDAGGKRVRPLLVLLAAKSCGIRSEDHVPMAGVIEFIHTATLLHDDVVDLSTVRRGRATANAEWDNPSSILVGDFIYSRAFQLLVRLDDMRVLETIADATNRIAEGEVLQLISKSDPGFSRDDCMRIIRDKTAVLFQAAARCGALLAKAETAAERALGEYGMRLGTAYQLIDDALDYDGDAEALGKNIGDDLAEGKPTLPLIDAMENAPDEDARIIRNSLARPPADRETMKRVVRAVRDSGALERTRALAREEADAAAACLGRLPASRYRDALADLAGFAVGRAG